MSENEYNRLLIADSLPETEEVNIDNINGIVVGLANNEIYWRPDRSNNEKLHLSAFGTVVSAKITNDMSRYDKLSVIDGLRAGRLVILDDIVKHKPVKQCASVPSASTISATRLLDINDVDSFENLIERVPMKILELCLKMEKDSKNRGSHIRVLKKKMLLISE